MRLTSSYSRVAVPTTVCPYCNQSLDWHREWYTKPEQSQLYRGEFSSDCPFCNKRVWLHVGPKEIDQDVPLLARSELVADGWILSQKPGYGDVKTFLQSNDPEAKPYKNYVFREYRNP